MVALVGGWNDEEREKKLHIQEVEGLFFFTDFEPDFLPSQAMKYTPIYRRSKRKILYLMVPNRGLWFG